LNSQEQVCSFTLPYTFPKHLCLRCIVSLGQATLALGELVVVVESPNEESANDDAVEHGEASGTADAVEPNKANPTDMGEARLKESWV
jgi:hypothetical protein